MGPEGALPFPWRLDADRFPPDAPAPRDLAPTRRVACAVAEGPRADTLLGGLRQGPDGRTRNAAVHLGPDGAVRAHYDKQTLMPFGETLPGRDLFPDLAAKIDGIADFGAGEVPCAFDAAGARIACGICYESVFAVPTRADLGAADLLVNLTIDTWFGTSNAPESHLLLQASRAAELGVPLVRAALTGISAVVGPDGQVEASLPLDATGVLSADVPLRPLATPFRAVGPLFAWLSVALTALALALAARSRRELLRARGVPPPERRDGAPGAPPPGAPEPPTGRTAADAADPGQGPITREDGASHPGEAGRTP